MREIIPPCPESVCMNQRRRRLVFGSVFVVFGLAAVAQAVLTSGARTGSVAWWATLVGGSVSAVAGAYAIRHHEEFGRDLDNPTALWVAAAGVALYLAGTILVLV